MKSKKLSTHLIADNTDWTWLLGTDIIDKYGKLKDLILMEQGFCTVMHSYNGAAALLYVGNIRDTDNRVYRVIARMRAAGYSKFMRSLVMEANRRGYRWIHFDRDIETKLLEG